MAKSGLAKTNTEYESYFWVKWEQSGNQDIVNNRTQIAWSCGVYCGHGFYASAIKMSAVTINGTKVYGGGTYSNFAIGDHTIASGTMWINHNSDGKKSFSISSFTGWLYANHNYSFGGGTYSLNDIPRQATITSVSDFTDVDNPTFTFSNKGNYTMDVWLEPNPVGDHLCVRTNIPNTGSYTWELTDEERDALRNSCKGNQCPIRVGLYTHIGDVSYADYKDKTYTMTENTDTKPSVTMTVKPNNGTIPSTFGDIYIQGKSRLNVEITADGKYGADIISYSTTIDERTYTSPSFDTDALITPEVVDVVCSVKNSRGFTGTASKSIEVCPYSKPLVVPIDGENAIFCYRSDTEGNKVGDGTIVTVKAKTTFFYLDGKNTCALQWRRKLAIDEWDDEEHLWNDLIEFDDVNTSQYTGLLSNVEFDKSTSYTVQIQAIDAVGEKDIKTFEIPTKEVPLHLGEGGRHISIGEYCDYSKPEGFHSSWVGYFYKGIRGASRNYEASNIIEFAKQCETGLTPFTTNKETENIPDFLDGDFDCSLGLVHKRDEYQCTVFLTDYVTGKIAIRICRKESADAEEGTWSDWKYIIPQ